MKYDQEEIENDKKKKKWNFLKESKLYEKYIALKQRILMRRDEDQKKTSVLSILWKRIAFETID
jgi:hypothetical protein